MQTVGNERTLQLIENYNIVNHISNYNLCDSGINPIKAQNEYLVFIPVIFVEKNVTEKEAIPTP